MSSASCAACGHRWDAALSPLCAHCEYERLIAAPNLIADKHDPRLLPSAGHFYRSCLSHDFLDNKNQFIEYATVHGSWLYSTLHETWNHFTPEPLGRNPGLGIHAGERRPDHTLDGLMLADALADPHAFAVDAARVRRQIQDGEFTPLSRCPREACDNLCVPEAEVCALHARPALAQPDVNQAGDLAREPSSGRREGRS